MAFLDFLTAFALGLLTPLTAVCVILLYPAFLSFLSSKFSEKSSKKQFALLGFVVTAGVLSFMLLLGLVFTTFLQASLSSVIGIVSPIAFAILALISLFLIFNSDIGRFFPKFSAPVYKNPLVSAFVFGFFFGAIVIPCNPLFIAAFFARAVLFSNFASSIMNFLFFGFGIGFPLLLFSLISSTKSKKVISFLSYHKRQINLVSGILMLAISLYYLFFVFNIFGQFKIF